MKKRGEEGKGYAKRVPAEALALLNALVGEDRQRLPWNLRELLELSAEAAPALRQSDPYRRLEAQIQ
jgi:hypothetical protein